MLNYHNLSSEVKTLGKRTEKKLKNNKRNKVDKLKIQINIVYRCSFYKYKNKLKRILLVKNIKNENNLVKSLVQ